MEACRLIATDLACRRGERLLFRALSLRLGAGSALQVTGPNGTGKSSLIRILAGLSRPFAGSVGREGSLALLDERPALDEHRSLGAALDFWAWLDGTAGTARLEFVELADLADVPVRYLSTGQRKRASLARLLGQRASIWLLDEPLNGLDAGGISLVETLVGEHCAAGGIAVIASHQPFRLTGMAAISVTDFQVPAFESKIAP